MMEKKNKEYYAKCARKIDKLFGELFDDCGDGRAALVVIETVAYRATALFAKAVEAMPPKKRTSMKIEYMADMSEILIKGIERFVAENKEEKE